MFSYSRAASAATLLMSPGSGSFAVGSTFTARVVVDSGGAPGINAADGTVTFDKTLLSVASVSRDASIFNLWTTEPAFSNTAGTITFGGGSPTAYAGKTGTIFAVTFRALGEGTAAAAFSKSSVLAADGKGTNVLTDTTGGSYTLTKSVATPKPTPRVTLPPPPPPPPPPIGPAPDAPEITSPTHADPELWYATNSPKFAWKLDTDITGVRLLLDHASDTTPNVTYGERISERELKDIADGEWYFHVQLRNLGGWGKAAHRKVLIDTAAPVLEKIGAKTFGSEIALAVTVEDALSGLARLEAQVDGGVPAVIPSEEFESGIVALPPQEEGEHLLLVTVYDRAGNFSAASTTFVSEGIFALISESSTASSSPRAFLFGISYSAAAMGAQGLVLAGLIAFMISRRRKFAKKLAAIQGEVGEAKKKTGDIFRALREEVQEQVRTVDKAPELSKEEQEVTEHLLAVLDVSEDIMTKDMGSVEEVITKKDDRNWLRRLKR